MIAEARATVPTGVGRQLGTLTQPWWPLLGLIALVVLLAAILQLAPPLIVRSIVDDHLAVGTAQGLLLLALLYLAATAGTQGLVFAYTYLAAVVAQRVLNRVRVELFGHSNKRPSG